MAQAYANGGPDDREPLQRPTETGRGGLKQTNMPRVLITIMMLGLLTVALTLGFFFNLADFF